LDFIWSFKKRGKEVGRKVFFFEKKNQKTFANGVRSLTVAPEPDSAANQAAQSHSRPYEQNFFGSFFQKRTSLLSYLPA
jgi:hypothetical protein